MGEKEQKNGGLLLLLIFLACLEQFSHGQEPVAFTLLESSRITVAIGSTLGFSRVITRMGPDTDFSFPGVFTSPANGIYKFQVYWMTEYGYQPIWLELYKNRELVASLYCWPMYRFGTTGKAVILHLNEGEEVSVQTNAQTEISLQGQSPPVFVIFSGSRLVTTNGTDTDVAFSTTLTSHTVFIQESTILYNRLLLNQGNGFNTNTGIFTAPVAGVYIFHIVSLAKTNQSTWQDLYHGNEYICSLSGLSRYGSVEAGNTAILYMKSGDTVQVKARRTHQLFVEANQIHNVFSGALIAHGSLLTTRSKRAVAFSVGLTRSIQLLPYTVVLFNRIFTNLQNTFDQRTGNFTAPVQGVYEFNVHAQVMSNINLWLQLYHNNDVVVEIRADIPYESPVQTQQYGTIGNSAIIHLQVGDSVYLKTPTSGNTMFGTYDQVYCTFSGHLIASTYTGPAVVG